MALPTSGTLALSSIATEFTDSAPHSLSEFYSAASGVPASGAISISDFYGKSAGPDYYALYGIPDAIWGFNGVPGGGAITINSANVNNSAGVTARGWPTNNMKVEADNGSYAFQKMWSFDYRWWIDLNSLPANVGSRRIRIKLYGSTTGANNGTSYDPTITGYIHNASNVRVNILSWKPSSGSQSIDYTTTQTVQEFIDGNSGRLYLGQSMGGDSLNNSLTGDSSSTRVSSNLSYQEIELVP